MPKPDNDPNVNDNNGANQEPNANQGGEPGGAGAANPQQQGDGGNGGKQLLDKHGEPAINLAHHKRLMGEKDDEIAKLQKQLSAAQGAADKGADALKQIAELKDQLADEKVSGALRVAGCVDEKAAKARLDDFEGDVEKLKESCPYLFGGNAEPRQQGSTGARRVGAPDDDDAWMNSAFGIK